MKVPPFPSPRGGRESRSDSPLQRAACMPAGRDRFSKGSALSRERGRRRSRLRRELGISGRPPEPWSRGAEALGVIGGSGVFGGVVARGSLRALSSLIRTFLVMSPPDRGRRVLLGAGRPTEHPLPTPAGNPAVFLLAAFRPARLLGKAGVSDPVGSPSRALHLPMRTDPQRVLREPLIRGKSFDKLLARKEAFGPKEKGRQKPRGPKLPD